jgi:hypothetical protein
MSIATLWVEMVLSGSLFFLSVIFLVLRVVVVRDITFIADIKEYLVYIAAAFVGISYVFGFLAHRLIPLIFSPAKPLLIKMNALSPINRNANIVKHNEDMFLVRQHGSSRLNFEIDFQFSSLALLRSATVGFPLLGLSSLIWLLNTTISQLAIPILVMCSILGIFSLIAFARQRRIHELVERAAKRLVLQNKKP